MSNQEKQQDVKIIKAKSADELQEKVSVFIKEAGHAVSAISYSLLDDEFIATLTIEAA